MRLGNIQACRMLTCAEHKDIALALPKHMPCRQQARSIAHNGLHWAMRLQDMGLHQSELSTPSSGAAVAPSNPRSCGSAKPIPPACFAGSPHASGLSVTTCTAPSEASAGLATPHAAPPRFAMLSGP